MKRIYTVTLSDDDIPLSHNMDSDIREIAYWLYFELGKFDEQILCIDNEDEKNTDGLIKNELYDVSSNNGYIYKFDSDLKNIDSRIFEPFILSDKTFGFTVYENSLSDSELSVILEGVLRLLKMKYTYTVDSIVYDDKNMKNRFKAIDKLISTQEDNIDVKRRIKAPAKSFASLLNIW